MFHRVAKWFSPPKFEDEERTRQARLLHVIILAVMGLLLLLIIMRALQGHTYFPTDIAIAAFMGLMLLFLAVLRFGYVHTISTIWIVICWVAVTYQAWRSDGIRDSTYVAHVAVILAASLLLSWRAAFIVTIASILVGWYFAYAEVIGVRESKINDPFAFALDLTIIYALVALMIFFLIRSLSNALSRARQSNLQLHKLRNDLENQVAERTQRAALAQQRAEMAQRETEARVWQTTGQAQLANVMRGEQDVATLAHHVIQELCLYLEVQVGTLYLVEDGMLQLKGSYAFNKRKRLANRYAFGEGIVGQAALEKESITLTDLPEGYMVVKSGLGQVAPTMLTAHPFLYDGNVIGVVELGALTPFEPMHWAFLQTAAENIAIAFNTAQTRDRVNDLLLKTQQQADVLLRQEEALRSTNEALAAQAESLRASEAELEQRAEELERANQYKSEFLANMSHELRTPLNSMLILASLLRDNETGNLMNEQVESAEIIYNSGQDLLSLINEILDLSKVEAGKLEFHMEPVAINELVQTMTATFRHLAEEKEVDFVVDATADLPEFIETDGKRVKQVIKNLLSNAFKFTETGFVRLQLRRVQAKTELLRDENGTMPTLAIDVVDSGIGMTPAQQVVVFEGFQQADGSTSRKYGGTGLGLTISRELVTRLGGEISLTSKVGEGTVFTVYLPLVLATPDLPLANEGASRKRDSDSRSHWSQDKTKATKPIVVEPLKGRKEILIIEDDLRFAGIVKDYAYKRGFHCLIATEGRLGLQLAETQRPLAIILDLYLPDIEGQVVLQALKGNRLTQHIPVHVVSVEDEDQAIFEMGAVGFLSKPVLREDLAKLFIELESVERRVAKDAGATVATETAVAALIGKQVLAVDDDVRNAFVLSKLLTEKGVKVTIARSGPKALDTLEAKRDFDVVLMDIMMPEMDGYETIRRIRAQEAFAELPILALTARAMKGDAEKCLMAGANDYLAKPIDIEKLFAKLHHWVNEKPQTA